jgi:hypothetical protein
MKVWADKPRMLCATLGLLGAAISLVVGLYLISTMLNLSNIQDETSQIWFTGLATVMTFAATAYGSYKILAYSIQKGGIINIAGGAVLVATYTYFSGFSQPQLLEWINPLGIALVIPPILSGVISLIYHSKCQGEMITIPH